MELSKLEEAKDIQRFIEECNVSLHEVRKGKEYLKKAERCRDYSGTITIHISGNYPHTISLPNDKKEGLFYPILKVFLRRFENMLEQKIKIEQNKLIEL